MGKAIFAALEETVKSFDFETISRTRKTELGRLAQFIKEKANKEQEVSVNFIGESNSHRSILAQAWASLYAFVFHLPIRVFSSGLETVSVDADVLNSLKKQGFRVYGKGGDEETHFVWFSHDADPIVLYSKLLNDPINPTHNYVAILTYPQLESDDLKRADIVFEMKPTEALEGPRADELFDSWAKQIGTEVAYVFNQLGSTED
ncbi:hypothetical protein LAG90_14900 [Marinilongibacter aquaticus]|uniref:hypothetical protein n=1 Tax=Marinilongibacter aquaticus TaxID=2975157 RepID=UPI0021BDD0DA|nr:hypothetical protein [Marinilongibacter aquaticus]UBM58093.1 hypothetical protein LAG90_14900 [Marinilongibacter aquaticus]